MEYFRMGIVIHDNNGEGIKGEIGWTPASDQGVTHSLNRMFIHRYFGDVVLK